MKGLASFGVRQPVVANLLMVAIIAAGALFGVGLQREFFPDLPERDVLVTAPYPGASPREVEEALAIKIEDAVDEIDGVEDISTTVREGAAVLTIEFADPVDIDAKVAEVKREIDSLQDLPEGSDRITISKVEVKLPAIIVSVYGDGDEREMKRAIRSIKDDLRSLPGISDVNVDGFKRDEVTVEVRPAALLEHRLSLAQVASAIRSGMIELPGGTVRTPTANFALRSMGADERSAAIREIVVASPAGGRPLRLGDIAEVRDGFADTPLLSRREGKPSVNATVFVGSDEDVVNAAELAKAYVAGRNGLAFEPTARERFMGLLSGGGDRPRSDRELAHRLGRSRSGEALPGRLDTTTDLSRFVQGRLDLLTRNAAQGGVLVFITLLIFLNWRVSFWVAAGLLVSLAGTLVMMRVTGLTLNLLSMFGLIIVVGILVDDAIVVAENITRRHEEGEPALAAAIRGTGQVGWPVVATVLTTVAAFMPLAIVEGTIGDYLGVLPAVVACALLISLIESVFILPSHMGHSLLAADRRHASAGESALSRLEGRLDRVRELFFARLLVPFYERILRACLAARYTTVAVCVAGVIVSAGMIAGGRLEFIFFETDDAETVVAELRMPVGSPLERTDEMARRIEAAVDAQPEVTSFFASVGAISPIDGAGEVSVSTDTAQVIMELAPIEIRQDKGQRTSEGVIQAIRDALGPLPGVRSLVIRGSGGGPSGAALNYAIVGDDLDLIEAAVGEITLAMRGFAGVVDIVTSIEKGLPELQVELLAGATGASGAIAAGADSEGQAPATGGSGPAMALTRESLGRQVQGFAFGIEAFTFAGDDEDVDVRVMLPESTRRSVAALENQHVFDASGEPVPIREVARLVNARAETSFRRLNGQRVVTVQADVDRRVTNPDTVAADLEPLVQGILARYPGVRLEVQGRQDDLAKSFASLPAGFVLAGGLIYVILAWLFGSYTQPLVVMSAIPFALIGMVWGHLLMGYAMTFLSVIGFVALAGIVVNDSLIFMEFFNEKRREGSSVYDACIASGRARVRAILLTTITTALGLLPLLLERSFQARFLIPMAITIAFGLVSATGIILVVIPSLLMILSDIKRLMMALWSGRPVTHDTYRDPAAELAAALQDPAPAGGDAGPPNPH